MKVVLDTNVLTVAISRPQNSIQSGKRFKVLKNIPFPKVEVLSSEAFLELILEGRSLLG